MLSASNSKKGIHIVQCHSCRSDFRAGRGKSVSVISPCQLSLSRLVLIDIQFRQVVANFAQKEIAPRAASIDKTNKMPDVSTAIAFAAQVI